MVGNSASPRPIFIYTGQRGANEGVWEVCKYHYGEEHKLPGRSVGFGERCRGRDKQLDSGGWLGWENELDWGRTPLLGKNPSRGWNRRDGQKGLCRDETTTSGENRKNSLIRWNGETRLAGTPKKIPGEPVQEVF